jgi:hypothetical protein
MPRKGNPQHNARKRVARERAKAEHEAGFIQRRKRETERRRVKFDDGQQMAALAAVLLGKR